MEVGEPQDVDGQPSDGDGEQPRVGEQRRRSEPMKGLMREIGVEHSTESMEGLASHRRGDQEQEHGVDHPTERLISPVPKGM